MMQTIIAARTRRRRNMIATLLLSQGTPMLLAGDEIGNGQEGNNNAYCQDSPLGWINWADRDDAFFGVLPAGDCLPQGPSHFAPAPLLAFAFKRLVDGETDLFWRREDGAGHVAKRLGRSGAKDHWWPRLRMASGTPEYVEREGALLVVLNAGEAGRCGGA